MARKVFFSFHYDDVDSFRANVVRNHGFCKDIQEAGFWDKSIWESAQKTNETALKRLINEALEGTSVTCVLIGSQTYVRPWVRYEILKSIERGNGVFGVHINGIKDKNQCVKPQGPNPFQYLSVHSPRTILMSNCLEPKEWDGNKREWVLFDKLPMMDYSGFRTFNGQLHQYFDVYDWCSDRGYYLFGEWVEKAAKEAGR